MNKIVLLRHGESVWNLENRFTGWTDVDLTTKGYNEACEAGYILKHNGFVFDLAVTSVLKRAIRTLNLALDVMDALWVPTIKDWRMNERHYGALQGLNKAEVAEHYGADQVKEWRRSFRTQPPALGVNDSRRPIGDPRYRSVAPDAMPYTESLQDTMRRTIRCWEDTILPYVRAGRRVLVCAHNNSLRSLVKHLRGISDEDIMQLDIPTGVPLVFEFDDACRVMESYYLERLARSDVA